jgi:hypothetical protein
VLSLALSSTSTTGALSDTDWDTFNGKQAALGYTPVNKAGDTMTGSLTISGANYIGFDTANGYIGFPGAPGQGYIPHDADVDSILNSLNDIYINIDSGTNGIAHELVIAKGRAGKTGGTPLFKFGSDGNVGIYENNSFFGFPGSTAQGFSPFDSSLNFIFNSIGNIYFAVDTINSSTAKKFVFAHNADAIASYTEIASLNEAGTFALAAGGTLTIGGAQVVGARVVDARIDDTINSGDATTDGVIDAIRDALITHGLMAAA